MGEKNNKDSIVTDVNEQADIVINQIKYEIENLKNEEISYFVQGLNKEIDSYFESELNDLRLSTATSISQCKLKTKRDLLKIRQDLANKLFDEIRDRLVKFVNSKEYDTFLKNKLNKYKLDYTKGFFEVKENDLSKFKNLLESLNINSDVNSSNTIKIGGFNFVSDALKLEIDETLDTSLKEQEEWFQDNSGFTL